MRGSTCNNLYNNITSSPLEEDFEEDTADSDAAA